MKNRGLRKWMRQFVVSKLDKESEQRSEELMGVAGGKIRKLHDILAIQLRDYVTSVAKHRTKQLSGISNMALAEFKREFIDSDEELKTTLMYGFLTKKDVFKTEDDEEYILGLAKHGGFKMVTMNFDNVIQEEIVDTSEEFLDYIERAKEQKEQKESWAKSTRSVRSFLESGKINIKSSSPMKVPGPMMTRVKQTPSRPSGTEEQEKAVKGAAHSIKEHGIPTETMVTKEGIFYADQKAVDAALEELDTAGREDFLSRLEQVGSGFLYHLITLEQLQADYQRLKQILDKEQLAHSKLPKGSAKSTAHKAAILGMQEFKGRIEDIARNFSKLNVKNYMRGLKKLQTKEEYKGMSPLTAKQLVARKKEYWNLLYSKEVMKKRGLVVTAQGHLHKILPSEYRKQQPVTYFEKKTKSRKTGVVTTKVVKKPTARTMDYYKWKDVAKVWRKDQLPRQALQRKLDRETAKQKKASAYITRALKATLYSKSSRYDFNLKEANKVAAIMNSAATTLLAAKEKTKALQHVVNRMKKQKNTDKWNKQRTINRRIDRKSNGLYSQAALRTRFTDAQWRETRLLHGKGLERLKVKDNIAIIRKERVVQEKQRKANEKAQASMKKLAIFKAKTILGKVYELRKSIKREKAANAKIIAKAKDSMRKLAIFKAKTILGKVYELRKSIETERVANTKTRIAMERAAKKSEETRIKNLKKENKRLSTWIKKALKPSRARPEHVKRSLGRWWKSQWKGKHGVVKRKRRVKII